MKTTFPLFFRDLTSPSQVKLPSYLYYNTWRERCFVLKKKYERLLIWLFILVALYMVFTSTYQLVTGNIPPMLQHNIGGFSFYFLGKILYYLLFGIFSFTNFLRCKRMKNCKKIFSIIFLVCSIVLWLICVIQIIIYWNVNLWWKRKKQAVSSPASPQL